MRTHLGADDTAYRCVFQQEDDEGLVGVKLQKARPVRVGSQHKVGCAFWLLRRAYVVVKARRQ